MIYHTSTYYKIKHIPTRIKNIQGGQGAGKNISIEQIILEETAEDKETTTVLTDTYDNLRDGAISDFKMLYEQMGLNWSKDYNKTEHDLHHAGGLIQFRYASDSRKSTGKSKRRKRLYINEANKIGWEVASTYIGRTRGNIYLDYNPDYEFWAHTQLPKLKDHNGNDLVTTIIVTYKDNEMCPQSEIDYIESRKDNEEWYRVYGLGQTGYYSERRIYNFKFIDKIPMDAIRIPSGMDFGKSPDPTIKIDIWQKGNNLYIDEVFCENNLMPEKINGAERMSIVDQMDLVKHPKGQLVVADSAGATEIKDLRKYGYHVIGVKKGTGSQLAGIKIVRGFNLFITGRSLNIKDGIEKWFFKVDKNGFIVPEPDGHEPDGLASLRYVCMYQSRRKKLNVKSH